MSRQESKLEDAENTAKRAREETGRVQTEYRETRKQNIWNWMRNVSLWKKNVNP